jgi:hypothetical protein
MDLNFKAAKVQFFDRPVANAATKGVKSPLSKFGAIVRRAAKTLLRRKQKRKKLSDLTPDERRQYEIAVSNAKREGREPPAIWFRVHSKPGEPPRIRDQSPLRNLLIYSYDPQNQSVLVGPAKFGGSGAAAALEKGGTTYSYRFKGPVKIEPRPFMTPSLDANIGRLADLFRNSIK